VVQYERFRGDKRRVRIDPLPAAEQE